jgi:hypothetical protein
VGRPLGVAREEPLESATGVMLPSCRQPQALLEIVDLGKQRRRKIIRRENMRKGKRRLERK